MDEISNTELRLDDIPEATADWAVISDFAHTFDGYSEAGSLERCVEIARARSSASLTDLRICLFFEARSWRHSGGEPNADQVKYAQDVVRQIREHFAGDARDARPWRGT